MNDYRNEVGFKYQKDWCAPQMWLEMAIGAIAGGLFITSLLFEFSVGAIVALVLMIVGKGLLLLTDLGKPSRFLAVLSRPGSSWISKGAWGFFLFAILGILAVAPLVIPVLAWLPWSGFGLALGILSGLGAAFMMIYDGFSLADSKGVEFWRGAGLPIVFFVSAVVGGVGALMALAPLGDLVIDLGLLAAVNSCALLVSLICLYSYVTAAAKGLGGAQQSVQILTKGKLAVVFWVGIILVGMVVPLLVSLAALLGISIPEISWVIIGILEVLGVVLLRFAILNAGVYSPVI